MLGELRDDFEYNKARDAALRWFKSYESIQSAKLNGHDPYRYLADILERLPTLPAGRIKETLPQVWRPLHG